MPHRRTDLQFKYIDTFHLHFCTKCFMQESANMVPMLTKNFNSGYWDWNVMFCKRPSHALLVGWFITSICPCEQVKQHSRPGFAHVLHEQHKQQGTLTHELQAIAICLYILPFSSQETQFS